MVSNLLVEVLNTKVLHTTPLLIYAAHQRQSLVLFCPVLMVLFSLWLQSKRRAPQQEDLEDLKFLTQSLFPLKQAVPIQSKNSKEEHSCLQVPALIPFHGSWQRAQRSRTSAVDILDYWPREREILIHFLRIAKRQITLLTPPVLCHLSSPDALRSSFLQSHGSVHVFKGFVNTMTLPEDQLERTSPFPALHPGMLPTEQDAACAYTALPAGLQLFLPTPVLPSHLSPCTQLHSTLPTEIKGLQRSLPKQKLLLLG